MPFVQGIAKQLLFPVLPQFTEAFVQALLVPDGPSSDSGLKMEILKVGSWSARDNVWLSSVCFREIRKYACI